MADYKGILDNIHRFVQLTPDEQDALCSIIRTTRVKKRQYIVQPGFVSGYRNYVVSGAFRSIFLDQDGKEHTVQLAIEDWFITDFYSYITQTPATLFVEALEDSVIHQLPYQVTEELCGSIHHLSEFFRITTERAFAFSSHRALANISRTAEERYLDFMELYPAMVQRLPQKVIASYLGMSPEFLSKIRSQLARKS